MSARAFIASRSDLQSRLVSTACAKIEIDTACFKTHEEFLSKLNNEVPEMVFIDDSILNMGPSHLISKIRNIENLKNLFIIFTSTDLSNSKLSQDIGADAFLPIPFSKMKFGSVIRPVLNIAKRIVIASQSEDDIAPFIDSLKGLGFSISLVHNGDQCMTLIHRIFPDMVLSDFFLEDMSGGELCTRIKKANLSSHTPVMILSLSSNAKVVEECFEAGAQDVLLYPYDTKENITKITSIVAPPKKGRREKALVIDDSPMVRNLITGMFKQLGFIVSDAENGMEGLKQARNIKPDIITCDYDMPVMNGWEFCIEAKKHKDINHIPIIMVTARGAEVDKRKGSVLGVAGYLTKPFKVEDLKKSVAAAISDVKKRKEKEAISKYVSSDLLKNVSDVIEGVKGRKPEEKFITLLFSDICSFTPKCERLSPEEIINLLNSYFDLMIKILQRHNAIIDKLIGDAIVARFDSGDRIRDAYDAAASSYEMLGALRKFNKESTEEIKIRIGINSGKVILGNLGSESYRLDYTMIGSNVNITQRLESQAAPIGCLISSSTYKLAKDYVEVGPKQSLALKGISKEIEAYPLKRVFGSPHNNLEK